MRTTYKIIGDGFYTIWITNEETVTMTKGDIFDVSKSGYDDYLRFRHKNEMGLIGVNQLKDGIEKKYWEEV